MQTKKKEKKKNRLRGNTLCICLRRRLHELLYIPLFTRRWTKNGRESDVTAKKMCWWIQLYSLYAKLKGLLRRRRVQGEQPATKSMMSRTQSVSHSTWSSLSEKGRTVGKICSKKVKFCVETSQFWENMTFQSADSRQREKDQTKKRRLSTALGGITTITVCFSKPSKKKKG